MSWSSFHFAVGMACGGTLAGVGCMVLRKGWRWVPALMTAGGIWANIPDMPRLWRQDFPNLPLASMLGSADLERYLHSIGDIFFFHRSLDQHRHAFALEGLILTILFYNASIMFLMYMEHRQRNNVANRAWRADESRTIKAAALKIIRARHGPSNNEAEPQFDPNPHRSSHLSRLT